MAKIPPNYKPEFNREFLEEIKRRAKLHAKVQAERGILEDDPRWLSDHQWRDKLSAEVGFTYNGLRGHINKIEKAAMAARDAAIWAPRLAEPWRWGAISNVDGQYPRETLALSVTKDKVPWPSCFLHSNLFGNAKGPRCMRSGSLFAVRSEAIDPKKDRSHDPSGAIFGKIPSRNDVPDMFYEGEELRVSPDRFLFMVLTMLAGRYPFGRLCTVKLKTLEELLWGELYKQGISEDGGSPLRSLWRLTNCTLRIPAYDYEGPLLAYTDATGFPEELIFQLPAEMANLYYLPTIHALFGGLRSTKQAG